MRVRESGTGRGTLGLIAGTVVRELDAVARDLAGSTLVVLACAALPVLLFIQLRAAYPGTMV